VNGIGTKITGIQRNGINTLRIANNVMNLWMVVMNKMETNNFSNNPKKKRSAAQIIGPFKNKQAHRIFQDVINRWVEALAIEGRISTKPKVAKTEVERKYKSKL
jgi:hypothetical protein